MESAQLSSVVSPAGPPTPTLNFETVPPPSSPSSKSCNEPQDLVNDVDDDILSLIETLWGSDADPDVVTRLFQAIFKVREGFKIKRDEVITNLVEEPLLTQNPSSYSSTQAISKGKGVSKIDAQGRRNSNLRKYTLEKFPMCVPSANLYISKAKLLDSLARVHFATASKFCHLFGFDDKGQLYNHGVRDPAYRHKTPSEFDLGPSVLSLFTDSELEKVFQSDHLIHKPVNLLSLVPFPDCLTEKSLKSIFVEHDFNVEFLQSLLLHPVVKDSAIGYRSLSDDMGKPNSYANIYPYGKGNTSSNAALIDTKGLGIIMKYDLTTRKTTVFLQSSAPGSIFHLLRDAFENFKLEKEDAQRDPFFILVLVLRSWLEDWRASEFIIHSMTEWLDTKVQEFTIGTADEDDEVRYDAYNRKLRDTHRYVSQMRVEIAESSLVFKTVHEQHSHFLKFTGLESETSVRVHEQLEQLILNIETLILSFKREFDKVKASSSWLSTSVSLKHTRAMTFASKESQKATLALKENTDAMMANGALMQNIAGHTLSNSNAMRDIANKSQRESKVVSQIAVNTQRDAQSMKVLATLATFFLPASFISSIFGWSIISFEIAEDGTQNVILAQRESQIFAAVALGVTVVVLLFAYLWTKESQKVVTKQQATSDHMMEDGNEAEKATP
ncbi:hypothetical protein TWF281_005149 [Arthrobotrys megalospora]